jgi:glyoxylate/hydroxypyruvate reductase A
MSHTKPTILFASTTFSEAPWITRINSCAPERIVVTKPDPSVEYALLWKHEHGALKNLNQLKVIFSLGAGVDNILADPDLPNVPIVRAVSPDLTARMSEYVVWQVLDHHRKGALFRALQQASDWQNSDYQPAADAIKVGVLGLGELGQDSAFKLNTLGFDVSGWSRSPKQIPMIDCYYGKEGLDTFLSQVDILVCLLPHTDQTTGILGKDLFCKLKTNGPLGAPILINAGRGALQVEADILAALDQNILGAASLDVFEQEPLVAHSPLWHHPKVTVTPHVAAESDPDALIGKIIEQMIAFENGEPLENLIDLKLGY